MFFKPRFGLIFELYILVYIWLRWNHYSFACDLRDSKDGLLIRQVLSGIIQTYTVDDPEAVSKPLPRESTYVFWREINLRMRILLFIRTSR